MRIISKGLLVALGTVALSACSSDNALVPVQVIHAVANAPTVDVRDLRIGSVTLFTELGFKEATGFKSLSSGVKSIAVDADLPDGQQATVIGPADITMLAGNRYTIVAAGSVGSTSTPLQAIVLTDAATPVSASNTRVRIVHAAAGAPPVDIHVTGPADPIVPANAIAGGSTPFGSDSGPIEVLAGDYRVRVTLPGQTDPVFDSGTISLAAGADLLILAIDNTTAGRSDGDAPPITLLVADGESQLEILDQSTPADVRVVHAVPDLNGVDVYIDDPTAAGAPAIAGLDFPDVVPDPAAYIEFEPGTVNVLVTAAGMPGVIGIPATDITLEAGRQYTIYASNTLAAGIEPYITVDDDRSVATEARARIIHLSPSAGLVDIYVTAAGADITGLAPAFAGVDFQDDTGYVGLAAGTYDVTVTLAGTKTVAIGPAAVTLDAGGIYTAVARDPDPDLINDSFGLILQGDF